MCHARHNGASHYCASSMHAPASASATGFQSMAIFPHIQKGYRAPCWCASWLLLLQLAEVPMCISSVVFAQHIRLPRLEISISLVASALHAAHCSSSRDDGADERGNFCMPWCPMLHRRRQQQHLRQRPWRVWSPWQPFVQENTTVCSPVAAPLCRICHCEWHVPEHNLSAVITRRFPEHIARSTYRHDTCNM